MKRTEGDAAGARRTTVWAAGVAAVLLLGVLAWFALPFDPGVEHGSRASRRHDSPRAAEHPAPAAAVGDATAKGAGEPAGTSGSVLTVRDLANGAAVPDLDVRLHCGGRSEVVRTDGHGRASSSFPELTAADVVGTGWELARLRRHDATDSGVLWVFRWLPVEGLIRARGGEDDFDPRSAVLSIFVDDDPRSTDPWDGPDQEARWDFVRTLEPKVESVGPDGRFSVRVPRVRGIVLGASALGWRPDTARLDAFLDTEGGYVELLLRRGHRLKGVLVDREGNPIPGCSVWVFTIVRARTEALATSGRLQHRQPEGGFGGGGDLVTGEGFAKYQKSCRTDDRGEFEIGIGVEGGFTWLFSYVPGYRPVERELGSLAGDRDDLRLIAEPAPGGGRVRILADGDPLPDEAILVVDLDFGQAEAQPAIQLRTDPDGNLKTDYLVSGRRYAFDTVAPIDGVLLGGCLRWHGQETLDLVRDVKEYDALFPRGG